MSWLLTPIVHECALQSMLLLCGRCIVCRSLIHRFLDGIASSVGWCPLHRLSVAINCSLMVIALFDGGYCIICWWPVHGSLVAIASFVGRHCIVGWWSLLCLFVDYWNIDLLILQCLVVGFAVTFLVSIALCCGYHCIKGSGGEWNVIVLVVVVIAELLLVWYRIHGKVIYWCPNQRALEYRLCA